MRWLVEPLETFKLNLVQLMVYNIIYRQFASFYVPCAKIGLSPAEAPESPSEQANQKRGFWSRDRWTRYKSVKRGRGGGRGRRWQTIKSSPLWRQETTRSPHTFHSFLWFLFLVDISRIYNFTHSCLLLLYYGKRGRNKLHFHHQVFNYRTDSINFTSCWTRFFF